jgi:acyl carrier protein
MNWEPEALLELETELQTTAVELLAQALQLEASTINADTSPGVTSQWDSLAHMKLILAIEEHLGKQLGAEAIVSIASLPDIVAVLEADR